MRRLVFVWLGALLFAPPVSAETADAAPQDAGAIEEASETPTELVLTSSPENLAVASVHAILERKGARMEIVETVAFASREGTRFRPKGRLRLGLPKGALAPKIADDGEGRLAVAADARGFTVEGEVLPSGDAVTVSFEVPIEEGRVSFSQRFPAEIQAFQVISTWTRGGAKLSVEGATATVRDELNNGATALIAMRRDAGSRTLSVTLSGIDGGMNPIYRRLAFALCLALIAAGIAASIIARGRCGKGEGA